MKIKISFTDNEKKRADKLEMILRDFFSTDKSLKVRKPEKNEVFHHTYFAAGK